MSDEPSSSPLSPLTSLDSESEGPQLTEDTRTTQVQQSIADTVVSSSITSSLVEDTPMKTSANGGENGFATVKLEEKAIKAELEGAIFFLDSLADNVFVGRVASDKKIQRFLEKSKHYDCQSKTWDVPNTGREPELYKPHLAIIHSILKFFGYTNHDRRSLYDTHAKGLSHEAAGNGKTLKSSPDFMVRGSGKNYPKERPKENKQAVYPNCVSPIEIKTESSVSFMSDLCQVAVYARECFVSQKNRYYVLCPIITQSHLQLFIFHRSGVHHSRRIDIHKEPTLFVRIILGVCSLDDALVGFDTRVFYDSQGKRFITAVDDDNKPITYALDEFEALFTRRSIKGRGTCCWSAQGRRHHLLVKDSWHHPSRTPETIFLEALVDLDGVVQMVAYESDGTKISEFPVFDWLSDEEKEQNIRDRVFSRVVLRWSGRGLTKFESRMEILTTLRDAIAGHQKMLDKGILHRDVSINNVVIGKHRDKGKVGTRGVLIDLDMAVWTARMESLRGKDFRTGTRAYQSGNVLYSYFEPSKCRPHSHLDDLESFFYVLCWICFSYLGVRKKLPGTPPILADWDDEDPSRALRAKKSFYFDLVPVAVVPDFFGDPFRNLLQNLQSFFRPLIPDLKTTPRPLAEILKTSDEDYKTILKMFDDAIEEASGAREVPAAPPATPTREPAPPPPLPQASPSRESRNVNNSSSSSSRKRGSGEVDHVADAADSPRQKRRRKSYKPKTPSSLSQSIGPSQEDDNEDDE
ncbi:unnamed protein product [Cyclocybe aegerita]|uniref:Protein kinase domain-containing protein n=1 Tax=Cyclocybe aegerita TaxID=1973307 RepID=A0A8S0VW91_CYCAE|nr:unnamed protein product [Cyclocybe aegerita]